MRVLMLGCLVVAGVSLVGCPAGGGGGGGGKKKKDTTTTEPTPCENGAKDDGETDVDCGGECGPCEDGLACAADADCASGFCGTGYTCI